MKTIGRKIAVGMGEFLVLALLSLVPPLFIVIDVVVLGNGVLEMSVTELPQTSKEGVQATLDSVPDPLR